MLSGKADLGLGLGLLEAPQRLDRVAKDRFGPRELEEFAMSASCASKPFRRCAASNKLGSSETFAAFCINGRFPNSDCDRLSYMPRNNHDFHSVSSFGSENEDSAAKWIQVEFIHDNRRQTVHSLSEINRLRGQINLEVA